MRTSIFSVTILFFLLMCQTSKAQPGMAPTNYNFLFFKSDTGVVINNTIWDYNRAETRSTEPIVSANHYHAISICKDNINRIQDSIFCELKVQLTKGSDTMNVFVQNVKMRGVDYVIKYIPFLAGDYHIQLEKDVSNSYELVDKPKNHTNDNTIVIVGAVFEAWNITPKVWQVDDTLRPPTILKCSSLQGNWIISHITRDHNEFIPLEFPIYFDGFCGYRLNLEVNTCQGEITIDAAVRHMKFSEPACTEICCDSEYSMNIIYMLTKMHQITMYTGDTLILSGRIPEAVKIDDLRGYIPNVGVEMTLLKQ